MRVEPATTAAEARRILRLAWPVMLTSLNWTLMQLIDVAIVGHAGTAQLGALGASRTLTFVTIVMGMSALSGVLVLSARADGAGDHAASGDHLHSGIVYGLLLGLAGMSVLLAWADPLIRAVGVAPELAGAGAAVVRVMALAYPAQFVMCAASYFLEGISRPRRVTAINLAMLPANAVLAWAWTSGHLGLPALGAVGAASATACVSGIGALAMLGAAWTLPDAAARGVRDLSAEARSRMFAGVGPIARFGWVPAISAGLELAGFSWLIALSTQLGVVAAASFQAIFSLHNFAFAIGLGMGSAAGVRVGNAVGAGERDAVRPRVAIAAALAIGLMGALALTYALTAHTIVSPFSDDPEVRLISAGMLATLAPFMLFDGLQIVFLYSLRSLGDQVAGGINGIVAFFCVTGGLGWGLVRGGYGAPALVWAAGAGMLVAALLQGTRLWWVSRPGTPLKVWRTSA